MRILIMGLPDSGKTTLATELVVNLEQIGKSVIWFNADNIRSEYNDWDFSLAGRLRQATRMRALADSSIADFVICDFVAPLEKMRNIFDADYTIWLDTIHDSKYSDTNKLFEYPIYCDLIVPDKNSKKWAKLIAHFLDTQK